MLNLLEDALTRIDDPNSTIAAQHIEVLSSIKDENLLRQVADIIEKQNFSSPETRERDLVLKEARPLRKYNYSYIKEGEK